MERASRITNQRLCPKMHLGSTRKADWSAFFIHLTLTDEYPLAQAQVIIEAIATAGAREATQVGEML